MNTRPKTHERFAGMMVLSVALLVLFTAIHDVRVSVSVAVIAILMVVFIRFSERYWNQ